LINAANQSISQQIAERYKVFKDTDYVITDASSVSFTTCFHAMTALDIVRGDHWTRSLYQIAKLCLSTR